MASAESITINCPVTVDTKTAERCLKLLEIWQDDNPDKYIKRTMDKDGVIRFSIDRLY